MGGPRGYDGGKKIKGRKRHLLVDTQGNLLKNKVHPADVHDRAGAELLLSGLSARRSGDHFRRPAAEFSSRMFLAQAMFARTLAVTKPLPEQSEHRTSTRPP